jgi:signal peptidase I
LKGLNWKTREKGNYNQNGSSSHRRHLTLLATISFLAMIMPILFSSTGLHMVFVVATGSMSPILNPGDLIVARPAQDTIPNGTIIIFKSPLGGFECHRVAGSMIDGGILLYSTKGDNNTRGDDFLVNSKSVVGSLSFSIPVLGHYFMIPREIALALTMAFILSYLFFEFRGQPKKKTEPPARRRKEMLPRGVITASLLIFFMISADAFLVQSSVGLIYPISRNTSAVGSPKMVLQQGIVGTSVVYDGGTSADVGVVAPLWPPNWRYRKIITIDHTKVPNTDQANFPVLISLASDADLRVHARTDGFDIFFTSSDGMTKIPYQREKYTSSTGALVAWVQVATLSHTTDTVLYMYYGNAGASDQQQAANVWDSNFKGVWHLSEATGTNVVDSTSNGHTGTQYNSPTQTAGQINGSLNFDGSSEYIVTTSGESQTATSFTWSVWFKADSTTFAHHLLWEGITAGNGWGPEQEAELSFGYPPAVDNKLSFFLGSADATTQAGTISISVSFSDTYNWHYAVVVVTGLSSSPSATLYVDGSSVGSDTGTTTYTSRTSWNNNLRFGNCPAGGIPTRYFDGSLDEARVSSAVRTLDWISTEYNNQKSPSTFSSLSPEQTRTYSTYDYVLRIYNQLPSNCMINLVSSSGSNINRLQNLTISLQSGSTSIQIVIGNGVITQTQGSQVLIASASTINIKLTDLQASSTGTSYLYLYLNCYIQNTGVNTRYGITFQIT